MTRPTFLTPAGGLTDQVLADVLALAGEHPPAGQISAWTRLERLLVYDWAIREHRSASDIPTRRRDRPSFLGSPPTTTTQPVTARKGTPAP